MDRQPVDGAADNAQGLPANGLAFSPDEKYLYVGAGRNILRYDVRADGTLGNRSVLLHMDSTDAGGVDGMKVDRAGNIFTTGPGGIWIVSPAGKRLGIIRIAGANLAFGDADGKTLYLAARRDLYRVRLNAPGIISRPRSTNP
jgi:gluconolactonase